MGAGIAQVSAVAGHDVVLTDIDRASIDRGLATIDQSLGKFVAKGSVTQDAAHEARTRIRVAATTEELADCATRHQHICTADLADRRRDETAAASRGHTFLLSRSVDAVV